MFDIVTVGHFSIDFVKSTQGQITGPTLGGPPAYVSLAAASLKASTSVISKVGEDFPTGYVTWLKNQGIDLCGLRKVKGASTSFLLCYHGESDRQLFLRNRAPPIEADDIPSPFEAKAVHLAPIADEIPYNTTLRLRAMTSSVSADFQGLLRRFGDNGKMYLAGIENPQILRIVDVLKGTQGEIEAVAGESHLRRAIRSIYEHGVKTVIVTRGAEGSLVCFKCKLYRVAAAKPKRIVDTTGAGDVYMGAFLAEYVRGKEPLWCASVGSACASFVIEECGPEGFGSHSEVYKRAGEVYEKISLVGTA